MKLVQALNKFYQSCHSAEGWSKACHCGRPKPIHVGFSEDKVALGQVFLRVFGFPLLV